MHDRRVARMRARAAFHHNEAARLEAEADAAEAARGAGVSQWGSDLPPLFLQMVLERLWGTWPRDYSAIRATCSTWSSIHDAWCPKLWPLRWTAVMEDKMAWFQSVTEVNLLYCVEGVSSTLAELRSLPSLHTLWLPASCAERAVDAEVVYGLSTLTELYIRDMREEEEGGGLVEPAGEWVLDLSRLTTLSTLNLACCLTVTDEQVQAASKLTGLTDLNLGECFHVTTEGLRAVSSLSTLTRLDLAWCLSVTDEGLRTVSSLTALIELDLQGCVNVTAAGIRALRTALPNLTIDR